jgi:hypothetical protein
MPHGMAVLLDNGINEPKAVDISHEKSKEVIFVGHQHGFGNSDHSDFGPFSRMHRTRFSAVLSAMYSRPYLHRILLSRAFEFFPKCTILKRFSFAQ